MPASRIEVLLSPRDEVALETGLRALYADVCFIDERSWTSIDRPPVRTSISECSDIAAIWIPSREPTLVGRQRANGVIDGPTVGPVIQWLRGRIEMQEHATPILTAGSLAQTTHPEGNPEREQIRRRVWRLVKRLTSNDLVRGGDIRGVTGVFGPVNSVYVGSDALAASERGELVLSHGTMRLLPANLAARFTGDPGGGKQLDRGEQRLRRLAGLPPTD